MCVNTHIVTGPENGILKNSKTLNYFCDICTLKIYARVFLYAQTYTCE
jgi:hypothetical protein